MKRPQGFDAPPPPPPAQVGTRQEPMRRRSVASPPTVAESSDAPPLIDEPATPELPPDEPFRAFTDYRRARRERKRYERGEVRRFTKRTRRRRLAWLIALGVIVLLVLAVVLTAFSPLMALHRIEVDGTSRISAAAVRSSLDSQLGRPLPLVDLGEVRSDLSRFPLIRSYSVESIPPGTLIVRIVEREPIGVVQSGKSYDLVDPARVTISSSTTRPAGFPLIQVAGAPGSAAEKRGFASAASVLRALPAAVLAKVDTISAATEDDVTLTLAGGGPKVVWGSAAQSGLKAADLARLMAAPGASGVSEYDVSSPYSVVAR